MEIALPSLEQVRALLPKWRAEDSRLEAMFERYGEPIKALRHMGLLYWQRGELDSAMRMFASVIRLSPEQAPHWSSLGGVLFAAGHQAEAAHCIENALERDPSPASDWLLLGTIYSAGLNPALAEDCFLKALQRDPDSGDAAISLGLHYSRNKRFEEAAQCLKDAIARGSENPAIFTCLAQALSNLGNFPEAARLFGEAVRRRPDDQALRHKYGQARYLEAALQGTIDDGFSAYREAAGHMPEDPGKIARDAFHMLSGYGYTEPALRLGESILLANTEPDPIQTYLVAALKQAPIAKAPNDYVTAYFDKFADTFDKQLVEILDYHAPEKLHALVTAADKPLPRVLDLGCGTGLAGPLLKQPGRILTGVDLSPRMLEKAAARGGYDQLIISEAITFLEQREQGFDLIFAADFLVYVGDLTLFMQHAARLLSPGGLLALTIETTAETTFQLLKSGRFAHRPGYIESLAQGAFALRRQEPAMIRLEANRPVNGALMLFERI
jgi:predicted TPR repeat methyltransferase